MEVKKGVEDKNDVTKYARDQQVEASDSRSVKGKRLSAGEMYGGALRKEVRSS